MKRKFIFVILSTATLMLFAQTNSNLGKSSSKFIKGNITDKTAAVREASESEAEWITNQAIRFCLENKILLGTDRDLDGLAVAAILSISPEKIQKNSEIKKTELSLNLIDLFSQFDKSSTVQIAVLNKIVSLKDSVPVQPFTKTLNLYLQNNENGSIEQGVFKNILVTLAEIGDNESFTILYKFLSDRKYQAYYSEIETATIALIPSAMNEVISLIKGQDIQKISSTFALVQKNSKISQKNLCEISENVLNESILITENSSGISAGSIDMQLTALSILDANKWTRASTLALSYFNLSKKFYEKGNMNVNQFTTVISSLRNIAPLDAVTPLTSYLEELNGRVESEKQVSSEVALAVIKTLGAIGDKAAFDSLLAVTYLNYDESVLTAARDALSGLRWQ